MDFEQRIKEHKEFWVTMYGEEKWAEIFDNIKQKNPAKLLDSLDEKIDAANISAKYENGILKLELPKKEEVKNIAKEIAIQ